MGCNKIPFGISDFVEIRRGGYAYIDKTMFVSTLEELSSHGFYIRPHGFGRTTMLTMLEAYYDIALASEFKELFGDLFVGEHPTREHNSYLVAHFDFGQFSGNLSTLSEEINNVYNTEVRRFCKKYAKYLPSEVFDNIDEELKKDPVESFYYFISQVKMDDSNKVYVFVDNYDHVVESIFRSGGHIDHSDPQVIAALDAYFTFFNEIKNSTTAIVDKFLAVGTVPVTMERVLCGIDLGCFYTNDYRLNSIMGFNECDVRTILGYAVAQGLIQLPVEPLVSELRRRAGGYCFSPECTAQPRLYAPRNVISFVNAYSKYGNEYPASTFGCDVCPLLALRDIAYDSRTSALKDPFGIDNIMVDVENIIPIDNVFETRYFISILYYYGIFTIISQKWGNPILSTPNETSRLQIREFLNS